MIDLNFREAGMIDLNFRDIHFPSSLLSEPFLLKNDRRLGFGNTMKITGTETNRGD